MNADGDLGVALAKTQCPVCLETADGPIILNTILTKKRADAVRDMHGKVVELAICRECQNVIDGGGVWLVEADPEKSECEPNGQLSPEKAYRTGRRWAIRREAAERIFNVPIRPTMFIDPQAVEALGLPDFT